MWPEVEAVQKENKHELRLTGQAVANRISEGGLCEEIFNLSKLNFLEISNCSLVEVPSNIKLLQNLTTLVLHTNCLKEIPGEVFQLSKLKLLDLSKNEIQTLSEDIKNLQSLFTLNLSYNKIEKLPIGLASLKDLHVLDFSSNSLTDISVICQETMSHVSELRLCKNSIREVPGEIKLLSLLKIADLSDNEISNVPMELGECPKLKEVNLKGNKFKDRRLKKLVDQCHYKQVLDYIKNNCLRTMNESSKGKSQQARMNQNSMGSGEDYGSVPQIWVKHSTDGQFHIVRKESVKDIRPHIICCVIKQLDLTGDNFKKFIKIQNKIHDTVCDKRNSGTVATHDMKKLLFPLTYDAFPPDTITIHPLGRAAEMKAVKLVDQLQKEADAVRKEKKRNTYSGIHKYLYLIEKMPLWSVLLNEERRVISLPPITNSDITKISMDTSDVLVEVTSAVSQPTAKKIMDDLLFEMVKSGLVSSLENSETLLVEQIKVLDPEGQMIVVYPSRADLQSVDGTNINVVHKS